MIDSESVSLQERYRKAIPVTAGRVGHLTPEQTTLLRQLWRHLLNECTDTTPIPVRTQQPHGSAAAADLASLSFEPLVSLGSRENKPKTTSSGWLGWATKTLLAPYTPSPDPENQTAAEAEEAERLRSETVQEYLRRQHNQTTPVIPAPFKPLFEQPRESRTFRAGFWQAAMQMGDPDSWVLRFLRARQWDVDQALEMIKRTIAWRIGQGIDETVYLGESMLHHYTMHSGLAFPCMEDRLGNPVYVIRVRVNKARFRSIESIKRILCWQIETSQLLAARSDGRVTMLFDLTGFSRENMDLKLVRTLITLLTNYYPETLGILLLYVNSVLFSSMWLLIQSFIDPGVKAKIALARNTNELLHYIDAEGLIEELGGKKSFEYTYEPPTAEENTQMADAEKRKAKDHAFVEAVAKYEQVTAEWAREESGSGSTPGSELSDTVDTRRAYARATMRGAAVDLDTYIRARTLFHRQGIIKSDHTVSF
ncbi:phosphatidylinositol transfer protein csr1 [Coemansia sp. Benny D115]|nr:phosphatidylinositol transfer protein csr1 [Coemansia sp. Benny D115]